MKKSKEIFDINFFINEGYLLVSHKELDQLVSTEVKNYQDHIVSYRKQLRKFFELPIKKKNLFLAQPNMHPTRKCHYTGFWGLETYEDMDGYNTMESVDFCCEFYNSRNFFQNNAENFCIPEEVNEETISELGLSLPNKSAYEITRFIRENFMDPVLEEFSKKYNIPKPTPTLQLQCTYYPQKSTLSMHQDLGFFEGILGPAKGFMIQPGGRDEKLHFDLDIGEAVLYTGVQFQEYYKNKVSNVPFPLLHGVKAELGRMSIPFACLYYQ